MTPEQEQAIAEAREKIAKEAAPEEADTQAKQNVAGEIDRTLWDDIVGAAGKVASGATFGYADELRALVRSRLPEIYGDKTYEEHLAEARGVLDEFGEAHPKTAFGLELAGGAGTGGLGAAKVLGMKAIQAAPKLTQYLTSGAIGAGQGAVAGSGYAKEGERLKGAGIGAAIGGPLGAAIPAAIGGVSRLAMPKSSAGGEAQKLIQEGISLTPGQRMGGAVQTFEEAATSLPFLGGAIKGAQKRGIEDFNRAAINRALKPIGEKLDDNTPVGRSAIEEMLEKTSKAYEDLLPNMRFEMDVRFRSQLNELIESAQFLSPATANKFNKIVETNIAKKLDAKGGISGETFKGIEEDLGKLATKLSGAMEIEGRQLAGATKELQTLIRESLQRTNPNQAQQLRQINKSYRLGSIVEDASGKAPGKNAGVFTPSNLDRAVKSAKTFGKAKRAYVKGKAPMQDLSDPAVQRLSQTLPESGTAPRALTAMLLGGGAGAIDPTAGVLTGLAAGGYTRPGQAALNFILNRPQFAPKVAGGIRALQAPGIGAGATYGGRR
jgi:hypothetical protein